MRLVDIWTTEQYSHENFVNI